MSKFALLLAVLRSICSSGVVDILEEFKSTALANLLLAPIGAPRWTHGVAQGQALIGKPLDTRRSRLPVAQFPSSRPRVAVFGGRGFIGSRTCRTLVEAGCDVVSVSLSDDPPEWAEGEPWVQQVQWLSVEAAEKSLGQLDAAVSCVGNVRPNPEWEDLFGLNFDFPLLELQNGDVNVQIAEAAKRAGARRFTYISVSSDVDYAFAGALQGYIRGKRQAADAVRRLFGDNGVIVGPSLVYGGGRFSAAGKAYEAITSNPPTTFVLAFLRALDGISRNPQDRVNIIALSPPVDVDVASRAIVAGTLGSTKSNFLNGSSEIAQVAAEDGDLGALQAAAVQLVKSRSPISVLSSVFGQQLSLPREGASSLKGAPFEGALVGARPLLFPLPYVVGLIALVASFPRVPSK